jgi:NNP family nitrate/nitrite transporter-like MFS transporter
MFILGIAWAFGKASVFKYISDDYPHNIGTISGIVGLAGGLGGFVLPIMFGALMDITGVRSSAFMLMYGVVWVSLIWMYFTEVRGTQVMGDTAPPGPSFTLTHHAAGASSPASHSSPSEGVPASLGTALGRA